tara:strand:- start:447 stop:653 length:207 start_codon:yes stop_codon:yes gene_type:complete
MQFKISKNEFQKDGNCAIKSLLDSDQVNYYYDEIKMNDKFIDLFKKNKIFCPIPKNKIHIPGVFNERK